MCPLWICPLWWRRPTSAAPDKKFTVVLAAKIPGSQVAFLKKSGKHETEFDFAWKFTDAQNHIAGGLRDTLPVKMTNETFEEVIGSNLSYEGEITLPPGKYNLKVGGARERRRQDRNLRNAAGRCRMFPIKG